jgi:hypothetical protein
LEDIAVYERCLNEAEYVLVAENEDLVSVKSLWNAVLRRGKNQGFDVPMLADFAALLEGDRRFDIIPTEEKDTQLDSFEGNEEEVGEMEKLGVSPEDRVRLHRRSNSSEVEADEEITSIHRVKASRPAKTNAASSHRKPAKKAAPKKRRPVASPARKRAVKRVVVKKARSTAPRRSANRRGRKK